MRTELPFRVVWAIIGIAAVASAGIAGQDAARQAGSPKSYEGISLFGTALTAPAAGTAAQASYEQARRDFEAGPTENRYIWLGRRVAYLGRYREAITIYTEGLQKFPDSYRLYRHRGHRYLSIRQFTRAIADFEKAAALAQGKPLEIEPDGAPNKAGIPVSNTHFNIYYHLGLSYFLTRDFAKAEAAYRQCLTWSKNDDSVVAVTDWLYMTLRRTGQRAAADAAVAPIHRGMALIENGAYLDRVLMFKGTIAQEDFARSRDGESVSETAIRDYGMGLVALWRGDDTRARTLFERQATGGSWASFATIAAEVELADLVRANPDRKSVASTLNAWVLAWNTYDLDLAGGLFTTQPAPSYYSSEKPGRIAGREALLSHHKGFGFVPGGKASDSRLWLEDLAVEERGDTAFATATWLFDRDVAGTAAPQRGPVTFVLFKDSDGWRIAHAHFANE